MVQSCLSILIPLYNEEEFIAPLIERVLEAPLPDGMGRELIVVDDGSNDESLKIAQEYEVRYPELIRVVRHDRNRGKGAAIRTAIELARGEYCIIQDADLEYDPHEFSNMVKPLTEGKADAVYGSRFLASGERRVLYFWHALANHFLTTACNVLADLNLTDMETCYKAFRTELIQSIPLRSDRFGIEPEITIKLAKRHARIYEISISYHGRTYEEGKKIGLKDALEALWVMLRYWLSSDIYKDAGGAILDTLSDAPRFNRWMADTISPFLGNEVLEIGAGIGNLSRHLKRGCRRYIATDIDRQHLIRLRNRFHQHPRLSIRECNLERPKDFEPLAGQMESVVCLNVLEKVLDDARGLESIYSALKPGGSAIILVPHDPRIYGTLDAALGHHRRYTETELNQKMRNAGFEVERLFGFNRITFPGWYINGRMLRRRTFSRFQLGVFDRLVWLWRKIDLYLPWPSTSIIAVGRKPVDG